VLQRADWRFQLLGGILQLATLHFRDVHPLGIDYVINMAHPIDNSALEAFLDAVGTLTVTNPRMRSESPSGKCYVLFHQP
jgi:hypothetical protein